MPRLRNPLRPLLLALLAVGLVPAAASAQLRDVVAQEINVGRAEASLRLEFGDGQELSVEFDDGAILVDDESVGSYQRGDALDTAWRALLGEAVSLDDGALAERLRAWSPPANVPASEVAAAQRIDQALETALALASGRPAADPGAAQTADMERAMSALVGRPRRLLELGRAVEDLDVENVRVHVGEDVTIPQGETVPGSMVVVDGDLDVRGEVDGSVVMVGGALHLSEGGLVTGDIRLSDARIFRDGGEVEGDVSNVRTDPDFVDRDEIRDELRDELRRELREEFGDERDRGSFGALPRAARAFGELIGSVVSIIVIGVLGGGLAVYFGRENLEVVAEAARKAPVRAGMVGLAGAFLTLPAWILGALGLIVTIVGILALPFWIVLFPIAVCLAAALGYLAVAQSIGEWVARQRLAKLDWVRVSNPYTTIVAGVGALMMWFVASNVIQFVGFLGFVSVLLAVFGGLVTTAAVLIGFGAVLLTRGGRQPAYAGGGSYWNDPWDEDLGFGGSAPPPHTPTSAPTGDASASGTTADREGLDG
jgi:hypothetical protein